MGRLLCIVGVQQGRLSTKSYLEQFISTARPPIKDSPNRRSYCRDDLTQFIDDDVSSEIIDERDYTESVNVHRHQQQQWTIVARDGIEPSLYGFGSVRVLVNIVNVRF